MTGRLNGFVRRVGFLALLVLSAAGGSSSLALGQAAPTVLHTYTGTGWHLISSPFTLSQSFATLSITAFAYDPAAQNYVITPMAPADTFHAGQGYWVYVRGTSLDIPGPGTLVDSTRPFSVTLGQGWNLLGNPFDAATPLANVTVIDPSGVSVPYATALFNHAVSDLFVYDNASGGYQIRSSPTDGLNPWEGAWIYCKQAGTQLVFNPLPSSGPIVFMRNMGSNWVVYRMNSDGRNVQQVTSSLESATEPAISSDGTKVVFQLLTAPYSLSGDNYGLTGGNSQIYSINVDGTYQIPLTSGASSYHPGWSPDGARITFQSERDGPEEVFVMDADGSNVRRITALVGAANGTPDWSPNGTSIAYEYIATSNGVTSIVNTDGSNPHTLPGSTYSEWGPAWSPDGSKLAYLAIVAGVYRLFAMNADGSRRHQLSVRDMDICKPCWSPDGTRVLFTSGGIIYSVRTDSTGENALTDGTHQDAWPPWARG